MLFEGKFNWNGQLFTLYTHAKSKDKAFSNFMFQLSIKLDIVKAMLLSYFLNNNLDNWDIKEHIK